MTDRALESGGESTAGVHRMLRLAMRERGLASGTIVDVGCGNGTFFAELEGGPWRAIGVDVVRHPGYPSDGELVLVDLDTGKIPLPDGSADVVVSVETIEHVENPRALVREAVRLLKPGGWLFVTTPNQLSVASLACLLARGQFQYFQKAPGLYPAHITALLEIDLRRIAEECGLTDIDVAYSGEGRMPFTARSWPIALRARRGLRGRSFSDNVAVCGMRPAR